MRLCICPRSKGWKPKQNCPMGLWAIEACTNVLCVGVGPVSPILIEVLFAPYFLFPVVLIAQLCFLLGFPAFFRVCEC